MNHSIIHLSLLTGIGPATINRVIQTVSFQHLDEIYIFKEKDFVEVCGLSTTLSSKLVTNLSDKKILEHEMHLLEKHGIQICTMFDHEYPSLLKQIYLPPPVLYYKGTLHNNKALAVVGSRKAHAYAQQSLDLLLPLLINNGWSIVSGGALGTDTFAHKTTLSHKGSTAVILGSGLLRIYPSENKKLFDTIIENNGVLISSFSLEQEPLPGNFPARNRIIAGMALGCLVVQAAEKSGARITANFALEQGKEVFVVPGPINDPLSIGGNMLIQLGAKLVQSAQDILEEFNEKVLHNVISEQVKNNVEIIDPFLLLCKSPISVEDLAYSTKLSLHEVQTKLFDFQIEGKVTQNFAGLWCSTT